MGRISPLGLGDDMAQVTPKEFVDKMLDRMLKDDSERVKLVLGTCTGVARFTSGSRGGRGRKKGNLNVANSGNCRCRRIYSVFTTCSHCWPIKS